MAGLLPFVVLQGGLASAETVSSPCGTTGTFTSPSQCSYTTLGEDTFTVPIGVTTLYVVTDGGAGSGYDAGGGAQITADIPVTPGNTEYVEVGVGGDVGGGSSDLGGPGGAGGGLSGVYSCPGDGTNPNCAILVGGGGGGGGGTGTYGDGESGTRAGGGGGTGGLLCNPGGAGSNGAIDGGGGYGGGGGTCSAGGSAGGSTVGSGDAGSGGGPGSGGGGGPGSNYWGYPGYYGGGGGGGGGGYYGGGGGGGGGYGSGGGGGGGSSFAESNAGNVSMVSDSGTPSVTITWPIPSSTSITSSLNPSIYGQAVSFTATASPTDGGGTLAFAADGSDITGCASQGLMLVDGNYEATCTTSSLGTGTGTVTATYSGDTDYSGSYGSIDQGVNPTPSPAPPTITSSSSDTITQGVPDNFTVTATGTPTPSLSETGALPPGITFTDNGDGTATFFGTPAPGTGGNYPIAVSASNGVSPEATQSFVLTVDEAPAISSANNATFTVGAAGNFTFTTSAGFPVPSWSESGSLPSGVTFTDDGNSTATLAGTPASGTTGTYSLTVTASNGVAPAATQTFTLTVLPIEILTTSLPSGTAGVAYTTTLTAIGGNPPYTWKLMSGGLPKGIKLNRKMGVISGRTKQVGTLNFTVEVLDTKTKRTKGHPSTQNTATANLSIIIAPAS